MNLDELKDIYDNVAIEYKKISRFHTLTMLTYDVALAGAEKAVGNVSKLSFSDEEKKQLSYSSADKEIESVELIRGWISFEEYAEKIGEPIIDIQQKAESGEYGKVEEYKGEKRIFWPPEEQGNEDLPPVGSKKTYGVGVKVRGTIVTSKEMEYEDVMAYLASSKNLERNTSEGKELLNRETFLLYWSTFEQYVKNLSTALFSLFPEQVFKTNAYRKKEMSYYDIYELSSQLTNITDLKEAIIDSILGDSVTEKQAISKRINFIKDCYLDKGIDPYATWCVFKGKKLDIDFQVLDQVRIIRNAIVHANGKMSEEWDKINLIIRPADDVIFVDDELLLKTGLILSSISYNLYRLVNSSLSKRV